MAITVVNMLKDDSGERWKDCALRCAYRLVAEPGLVGIKLPSGQFFCLSSHNQLLRLTSWNPEPDSVWVEVNLNIEVWDA